MLHVRFYDVVCGRLADVDAVEAGGLPWSSVRLAVFDFDGVMTDNTVYVAQDGSEQVRCWRGDGIGLAALASIGVATFVLSTEANPVVATRCEKLSVPCRQGLTDKGAALAELAREHGVDLTEVLYVGNDINDLGCLQRAGLPVVVADAHPDVIGLAAYVTTAPGGKGAVREVCDRIVAAQTSLSGQ